MGDVKLAGVLGLFLGRAVGPAMFVALDRRHRSSAPLIMARKGVRGRPQDGRPVRPLPRPRRGRRPVRGRRDRRLVPRHLHLGRSTPPGRLKARRPGADKPSEMKAVNLLPPTCAGRPRRRAEGRRRALTEPGGIGAFVVLGALAALRRRARRVRPHRPTRSRTARRSSTRSPPRRSATQRSASASSSPTPTSSRWPRPASRPSRTSRPPASTGSRRCATSRAPSRPTSRSLELDGTISSDAGGSSALRSAIAAPAIELKGCTRARRRSPADVAPAQRRRRHPRDAHQVDQARQAADRGGAVADAGAAPTRAGCAGRRPPDFELVMFFERSEVPATVEDITVQPGAGDGRPPSADAARPATTEPRRPAASPRRRPIRRERRLRHARLDPAGRGAQ